MQARKVTSSVRGATTRFRQTAADLGPQGVSLVSSGVALCAPPPHRQSGVQEYPLPPK